MLVVAGLVPAIHVVTGSRKRGVDARDKRGMTVLQTSMFIAK